MRHIRGARGSIGHFLDSPLFHVCAWALLAVVVLWSFSLLFRVVPAEQHAGTAAGANTEHAGRDSVSGAAAAPTGTQTSELRQGTPERGAAAAEAPDTRTGTAALIIPVRGVQPEELVDTFEAARSQGQEHNAIDILAPRGTPVQAAADGRVLRLFLSDAGGITLYQLGTDGRTVYYYAHLDRYAEGLAEDQFVRQGEVIGYVGDTGNAVPGNHHLHFAMWTVEDPKNFWDGPPINPYPLLRGE